MDAADRSSTLKSSMTIASDGRHSGKLSDESLDQKIVPAVATSMKEYTYIKSAEPIPELY